MGGSGGRGPGGVLGRGALRLRGAGAVVVVVVRLLGAVVQHEGLGLVGDGDGAGTLGPRLPVHLHRHRGALEEQLEGEQRENDAFMPSTLIKKGRRRPEGGREGLTLTV